MIDISERAQRHFLRLLSQQGIDGLSIRLRVTAPGTPAANCELEFCEPDELSGNEWTIECDGFLFQVEGDSAPWLDGASIDYESNATGGQLNIRAPRIKGDMSISTTSSWRPSVPAWPRNSPCGPATKLVPQNWMPAPTPDGSGS